MRKQLIKNSVKCLECGEILESKHRHQFSMCSCPNETATDGGNVYQRYMGRDLDKVENLSQYIYMTEQEYQDMLEKKRIEDEEILQKKIDAGLMIKFGEKWISKEVYNVIVGEFFK